MCPIPAPPGVVVIRYREVFDDDGYLVGRLTRHADGWWWRCGPMPEGPMTYKQAVAAANA